MPLTTTNLNVLLPGIMSHYGAGQPVDVHFNVIQLGDFESFQNNQEMQGVMTLDLQYWVHTKTGGFEKACDMVLHDSKFGFIAPTVDMSLTVELTKFNVDRVEIVSDTFGFISGATIKL